MKGKRINNAIVYIVLTLFLGTFAIGVSANQPFRQLVANAVAKIVAPTYIVEDLVLEVDVDVADDDIEFGGDFAAVTNLIGTGTGLTELIYVVSSTATSTSGVIQISHAVDQIDLNIYVKASSTTSKLTWQYEFSDDTITWYGEDSSTASGNTVTHQAATTTHEWTPGTTEVTGKNVGIQNIASRFFRLQFFRGANSAIEQNNFAVWIESINKVTN